GGVGSWVTGYADAMVSVKRMRLIPRTTARRLLASATIGVAGAGVWAALGPSLLATAVSGAVTDALNAGLGIALVIHGALVVGSVVRSTDASLRR
ncbi:MAG: hypothetical protein EB107_10915, partial [Proteobacteria bacterium]|nr:hypothetical protein [Pseudomonadota bacterium]